MTYALERVRKGSPRPLRLGVCLWLTLATLVVTANLPAPSHAYCRATTCSGSEGCAIDANGCLTDGLPTSWEQRELTLTIDASGSRRRALSGSDVEDAVLEAVSAWTNAECPSGDPPAIKLAKLALSPDREVGYDRMGPNQNVIRLYDEDWPYAPKVLGWAEVSWIRTTGELVDVDISLNSRDFAFSSEPGAGDVDLVAVLTHELGHLLGLDHSDVPGATMQPETPGFATSELRSLEPDDVRGICAIYPPRAADGDSGDPAADGGTASCSASLGHPPSKLSRWAVAACLLVLVWRRRIGRTE